MKIAEESANNILRTVNNRKNAETSRAEENGDDNHSFADKRNLFEQLTTTKGINADGPPRRGGSTKTERTDSRVPFPPPKPIRTFAHDQYLCLKPPPIIAVGDPSEFSIGGRQATTVKTGGSSKKPIPSPRQSPKPKPAVVARRGRTTVDIGCVRGVSHEYEHILSGRSPLVLRERNLRRSLSDDRTTFGSSNNVEPLFYASSPVPRPSPSKYDRIYDTPITTSNGKTSSSKYVNKLHRHTRDSLPLARDRNGNDSSPPKRTAADDEHDDEVDVDDLDTPEAAAIDKRVNRARLMRRRTLMHYDQQEIAFIKRQLPQLFELAALVRLEPNVGSNPMISRDQKYSPSVVYRFPPLPDNGKPDDGSIMASLSCLCYPDISKAILTSPETYKDEQFVMTITDQYGDRKFAYCYRFVPMTTVIERSNDRLSPTGRVVRVATQNGSSSSSFYSNETVLNELPQVFCVVTPVNAPNFYNDFVREAATKAKRIRTDPIDDDSNRDDLADLKEFLQETFWRSLPPPGGRLLVRGSWGKEVAITHRMSTCKGIANGLSTLVERIGIDHASLLFTSLLSERRVLLVGDSVPTVSKAVQAAASLLAPFEWPHTFVPVVPDPYVHLCFSPTPYLMGLLRSNLHYVKDMLVGRKSLNGNPDMDEDEEEYILILDLDYGVLKNKDFNDDNHHHGTATISMERCLPSRTGRLLKNSLRNAIAPATGNDSMTTATSLQEAKDAKVADAFLTLFVDLIGHYKDYMVTQQDGHVTFQKQPFVGAGLTESHRAFLKWFVETGMFQVWLKKKLDSAMNGGRSGGGGATARSMTMGSSAVGSDPFDRKLALMKARQGQGAAYQVLLNAVARRWTSFLRKSK